MTTTALPLPDGTQRESVPGRPPGADPLPGQLDRWLAARGADLVAIRRRIHAHPELAHSEFETAALIARELTAAGLQPQLLPRGNGVICDIGDGDRVIAFRADLDALPLPDGKDVPYRSTVAGVAHACGHDVHATVLLGLGLALARLRERGELPGRVRLIFQPAEESVPSGAPEMIGAGALTDVAAVYALHCYPQLPVGLVGVRSGPFTAAADTVEVTLTGPGGHTARPHLTADLVDAVGRVIVDVPRLLYQRVDPRKTMSLIWGAVNAGDAFNTIPGGGTVRGTLRTFDHDVWLAAPQMVSEVVRSVALANRVEAEVTYRRGFPAVINDVSATALMRRAAILALGTSSVVDVDVSLGSEDFAFYLQQVPGAMVRLGTAATDGRFSYDTHHARFDVDEQSIGYGVAILLHTALIALSDV